MGAADVGAPHQRDRIWILATDPNSQHDAMRRDSQDYEETLGGGEVHARGGISNSGKRHQEVSGEIENMAYTDCGMRGRRGTIGQSGRNANGGICSQEVEQTQYDVWCETFGCHPVRGEEEKQRYWWQVEPNVDRVVDGMAARVDRLKGIGNGQVPLCAATAWRILNDHRRRAKALGQG